jgi:hypothetical protein
MCPPVNAAHTARPDGTATTVAITTNVVDAGDRLGRQACTD